MKNSKENTWSSRKEMIACLTYTLIQNNVINITIFRLLLLIEGAIITYFAYNTLERIPFVYDLSNKEQQIDFEYLHKENVSYIHVIEDFIKPCILINSICCFAFQFIILISMLVIAILDRHKPISELKDHQFHK